MDEKSANDLFQRLKDARAAVQTNCKRGSFSDLSSSLMDMGTWLREGNPPPDGPCPRWLFWAVRDGQKKLACNL